MTLTNFRVDLTGHIQNRRIARDEALLISEEMLSLRAQIEPTIPAQYREAFDALMNDLERQKNGLEMLVRRSSTPTTVQVEPTQEALAIEEAETLASPGLLNTALDHRVSGLNDVADGGLKRSPRSPKHAAGLTIKGHFFVNGLQYLQTSYRRQWQEIRRLFDEVPASVLAAARLLAGDDLIVEAKILNDHFGRLLGLTEASPESPDEPVSLAELNAAHSALAIELTRSLAFAFLTWPSQDGDDPINRARLIGPFLRAITS